jgi:MFS family permease
MVVFIQLPLTRKLRPYSQWLIMASGSLLIGIGFGLFGFVVGYSLFMLAFVIITFGEMIVFPTREAIVAQLAPEDMRGRYMAAAAFGFAIPNMIGPTLGGLLLDHADPNLLWYLAGIVATAGAAGYFVLYTRKRPYVIATENK